MKSYDLSNYMSRKFWSSYYVLGNYHDCFYLYSYISIVLFYVHLKIKKKHRHIYVTNMLPFYGRINEAAEFLSFLSKWNFYHQHINTDPRHLDASSHAHTHNVSWSSDGLDQHLLYIVSYNSNHYISGVSTITPLFLVEATKKHIREVKGPERHQENVLS